MARQTRAQRRARRERQAQSEPAARQPARQPQPVPAAPADTPRPHVERSVPGNKVVRFIGESWGELKKVEWPTQSQVIQATAVVLIACAIVGVYLWGADLVFKRLVQNVLLGQ
jgi:preprotein translocase subunit SecE